MTYVLVMEYQGNTIQLAKSNNYEYITGLCIMLRDTRNDITLHCEWQYIVRAE